MKFIVVLGLTLFLVAYTMAEDAPAKAEEEKKEEPKAEEKKEEEKKEEEKKEEEKKVSHFEYF